MANRNLEKGLKGEDSKVDVEQARALAREVLADKKSSPKMLELARSILADLGDDVSEVEKESKRVAKAMGSGPTIGEFCEAQRKALGGR